MIISDIVACGHRTLVKEGELINGPGFAPNLGTQLHHSSISDGVEGILGAIDRLGEDHLRRHWDVLNQKLFQVLVQRISKSFPARDDQNRAYILRVEVLSDDFVPLGVAARLDQDNFGFFCENIESCH